MHAAAVLRARGELIYSPIAHSHEMAEYYAAFDLPVMDSDWWATENECMLERCQKMYVLMLDGWDMSFGVQREIEYCKQHRIPTIYINKSLDVVGGDGMGRKAIGKGSSAFGDMHAQELDRWIVASYKPPLSSNQRKLRPMPSEQQNQIDLARINPGGFLQPGGSENHA